MVPERPLPGIHALSCLCETAAFPPILDPENVACRFGYWTHQTTGGFALSLRLETAARMRGFCILDPYETRPIPFP